MRACVKQVASQTLDCGQRQHGTRDPEEALMALSVSAVAAPAAALPTIPLRNALPWAAFASVVGVALLYFVGIEQSAVSVFAGSWVHEFVHDARHLAGLPCH